MQGSMGHAAAIGNGIALGKKKHKILVIDGDGALLMQMGILANIGVCSFESFIHIVLDNGIYASTGGQLLPNQKVNFSGIALNCGYQSAISCHNIIQLKTTLENLKAQKGNHFLHIYTHSGFEKKSDRPSIPLPELAEQFKKYIQSNKN